jgi:hypothetical protein
VVVGAGVGLGDAGVLAVVELGKVEAMRDGVTAGMPKVVLGKKLGSWR